ncbi:hypothetical protein JHK87_052163 [Glycine soja]|nr:hypothetical protein JHK87_052163 [Glycine soja]
MYIACYKTDNLGSSSLVYTFYVVNQICFAILYFPSKSTGRNVTNDLVRHQPVTQRSLSTKRSKRSSATNLSQEIIQVSSLLRRFTFNDLRLATRNFESKNLLGEGGFGTVLKGWVNEHENFAARPGTGTPVAVKTLNPNGFQGHKEWLAEINYLSELSSIIQIWLDWLAIASKMLKGY